jgi:hypothetical protein
MPMGVTLAASRAAFCQLKPGDSIMVRLVSLVIVASLVGCGSPEEAEKKAAQEELSKNTVTLDPPPGTYAYKPWVIMRKESNDAGSGVLTVKAPGKTAFESAGICWTGVLESTDINAACVQIEQTGTLSYYLENSAAKSDEQSAEYKVELATSNIATTAKASPDAEPEAFELAEVETFCKYVGDGTKLEVVVQTKNDARLTANRYAYIYFTLTNPAAGSVVSYGEENDIEAGIEIKPTSDDVPWLIFSSTYTTKPPAIDEVEYPAASCQIKVEAHERARVTKGTFSCENLRSGKMLPEADDELLGKMVGATGAWQCENYRE